MFHVDPTPIPFIDGKLVTSAGYHTVLIIGLIARVSREGGVVFAASVLNASWLLIHGRMVGFAPD